MIIFEAKKWQMGCNPSAIDKKFKQSKITGCLFLYLQTGYTAPGF